MIITLFGENKFELNAAKQGLAKSRTDQPVFLDGSEVTEAQLNEQLFAPSLFKENKFVIINQLSRQKDLSEWLIKSLDNVSDDDIIVLVEENLDKRTLFYKTLQKKTDFREFKQRDSGFLRKWLQDRAKQKGGGIDAFAASELIDRVGLDQWQLDLELDKLVAFSTHITKDSVNEVVEPNLEVSSFALMDALFSGKHDGAKELLKDITFKSDPYEFFGLLAWQVNAIALVAYAPSNLNGTALSKKTGLKPFVIQKSQVIARKLGKEGVKKVTAQVAALDMKLKSSGMEPWILIEQALARIMNQKNTP